MHFIGEDEGAAGAAGIAIHPSSRPFFFSQAWGEIKSAWGLGH